MTAAQLKRRRIALGLTQAQLAACLGLSHNTIVKYEMGLHRISGPVVRLVATLQAVTPKHPKLLR